MVYTNYADSGYLCCLNEYYANIVQFYAGISQVYIYLWVFISNHFCLHPPWFVFVLSCFELNFKGSPEASDLQVNPEQRGSSVKHRGESQSLTVY